MTYSEYLTSFTQEFISVLNWIKINLFRLNEMFTNYLVFTLIGISFILLVIEEIVGIITSFRFGGFIFRHFRIFYPRSYEVADKFPDYSKEGRIRPFRPFYKAFYKQKYQGKYFIKYNGRYYPVSVPRYNPFAIAKFKAEYKAGNIISYDSLYKSGSPADYKGSAFKGLGKTIGKKLGGYSLSGMFSSEDTYSEGVADSNNTLDGAPYSDMYEGSLEEQVLKIPFDELPFSEASSSDGSSSGGDIGYWGDISYDD